MNERSSIELNSKDLDNRLENVLIYISAAADSDIKKIDSKLGSFNVESMSNIEILAWLRYTVSYALDLPEWFVFRDKAAIELAKRGEDIKKIMRGLLKENDDKLYEARDARLLLEANGIRI